MMKKFQQSDLLKGLPEQFFASLVKKVAKEAHKGHDLINFGQGNPDKPTPNHIVMALQEASNNPQFHGYPPFQGHSFLKEAAASFYKQEYGVTVDPTKEVAILFGGKAGLVEIPQCLLNKGDGVLVPDPGYPDYLSGVALAGATLTKMPLTEQNDFLPDYSSLSEEDKQRAKLMFLNYPNNPTGAVASKEFFEDTVSFADKNDICVVHDFAYGAIGFDGKKPRSFLQTEGAKDVGIEIYTFSKTFNMAGWRIAFAVGNESVIKAIELLQDHLYVSIFSPIQKAAEVALLHSHKSVQDLLSLYERRREVWIGGLQNIGWDVKAPAGSFFAWLRVPKGYTSTEFSDLLLKKAHVVVAPGIGFGEHGEGYVRTGLLTEETRIREAIERIKGLGIF